MSVALQEPWTASLEPARLPTLCSWGSKEHSISAGVSLGGLTSASMQG